jgi:hypothetical protein
VKVIGNTKDGYILEASENEVANLIGYSSHWSDKFKRPSVGDDIQINKMYRQLYDLEHNQPELRKVIDTLRGLADMLEPVCPVIEKQIKEAVKANE